MSDCGYSLTIYRWHSTDSISGECSPEQAKAAQSILAAPFDEAAERVAFEEWAFTRWPTIRRLRINLPGYPTDGEYEREGLQAAWTGYLACAKRKAGVQ